jgi:hypothetical protein
VVTCLDAQTQPLAGGLVIAFHNGAAVTAHLMRDAQLITLVDHKAGDQLRHQVTTSTGTGVHFLVAFSVVAQAAKQAMTTSGFPFA